MNPNSTRLFAFVLSSSPLWIGATASAAFTLVDNFESRTLGDIDNQGSWRAGSTAFDVTADPTDAGNKVLTILNPGSSDRSAALPVSIADNTTATLYFRLQRTGNWNFSIGMSDLAIGGTLSGITNASSFNDYESQLNFNRNETNNPSFTRFNNASNSGGSFVSIDTVQGGGQQFDMVSGDWYQFWIVINSTTNVSNVWVAANGASGSPTQLINDSNGTTDFRFRNGTTNANELTSLFITYQNGAPGSGRVDDIYLDTSGANLTNPIPEPSAALLAGLGALVLLRRRRH